MVYNHYKYSVLSFRYIFNDSAICTDLDQYVQSNVKDSI